MVGRAVETIAATRQRDCVEALARHAAAPAGDPAAYVGNSDVVVTTYSMVSRVELLSQIGWSLVVVDEAQAIGDPGARQSRAVEQLESSARIALTGTPVEYRLSDLWSIFGF